jgi:hypothetical protein
MGMSEATPIPASFSKRLKALMRLWKMEEL